MPATLPLARHVAFETSDLDEARERVARIFCPHRLDALRPGQPLRARQHVARIGNLALSYVAYGAEVMIDPGALESFFLVHLVHSGACEIGIGRRIVAGRAPIMAISSASLPLRMRWNAECAHVVLKIGRAALERHLAGLIERSVPRPIEFQPGLPLDAGPGAGFRRLIEFACAEAQREESLLDSPLAAAAIEQTLMTVLLTLQPHTFSAALAAHGTPAAPRHVVRAVDYIRAHADLPITIADLAGAAGVSARTLHEGFRRFRGSAPMAFLKSVRLERVRADLKAAAPGASVTSIAHRWGVIHLGRFAQEYRKRFGELPSETFRR